MRPYLMMLGGAFAFAVMGALTHAARDHCDWQWIAFSRSVIAALIAGTLVIREGQSFVLVSPGTLWVRSLAGSISVLCNFYALTRLPIADALTLTNMFPVWIALFSWPVLGKFPEREVWLSVFCGMAGVVVLLQPDLAEGNLGTLSAVSGSVTSAIALMGLHHLRHVAPNAIVVHFSTVSVFVTTGMMLMHPSEHRLTELLQMTTTGVILLLGVGIAATTGQMLLTRAFAVGAPARISVVGLSQVGFAMIFDILLWHREFAAHSLIGMFLVMGPTAWLMLRGDVRKNTAGSSAERLGRSEPAE